jgi:hypothetical protein
MYSVSKNIFKKEADTLETELRKKAIQRYVQAPCVRIDVVFP